VFGDHGLCGLLEEGAYEKSPKCLGGDFEEFCKGLYLTFRAFTISYVACNLLHEQTTHGMLFNLSGTHDFVRSRATCCTNKPRTESYLTFRTFTISCNKLHATIYMVQDNLSTKEHINHTFYVRITIALIYRNSKMFTHKKKRPERRFHFELIDDYLP